MFSSSAAQSSRIHARRWCVPVSEWKCALAPPNPTSVRLMHSSEHCLMQSRIGYLPAGSGAYLAGLLERLGIADAIKAKVTRPETDIVSEMVAKGELEIGMVVITQILTTPGVDFVGPLPPELQHYIEFIAGVSANSKARPAAMELLRFLKGPVAIPVIRSQGMEPL